ncbi:MAG: hypothetical protein JNK48_06760 [Bryobacterales bacterium]|nr:hypothetical protein [Bryobacterales bacterium]
MRGLGTAAILLHALSIGTVWGQTIEPAREWRRIGSTLVDMALPAPAGGPVGRVWYNADGSALSAQTGDGKVWITTDFESWKPAEEQSAPTKIRIGSGRLPEPNARLEAVNGRSRAYAMGRFVYRSEDAGRSWTPVTAYRDTSILGEGLLDIAANPRDPDELTVSSQFGIWRSLDGGATWAGLNDGLPNFAATRLLAVPNGLRPARASLPRGNGLEMEVEWLPGERALWREAEASQTVGERALRSAIGTRHNVNIVTVSTSGDWIYAGSADGRLFTSSDRGQNWTVANMRSDGAVRSIYVHPKDPRVAVLALSGTGQRIMRTYTGGRDWFDATGALPGGAVYGVTAEAASGALYVAMESGVYYATADLSNLVPTGTWQRISAGLPSGSQAVDVRLDDNGNQLFVLVAGHGLFATMAPHRLRELAVVNAADYSARPAAPGTLLSVLGSRFDRATAGGFAAPVLPSTDFETQIQVPFEVQGSTLPLVVENSAGRRAFGLPLAPVSPAVFTDRDGTPLLLDADSGVALDAANPARSGTRVQILATGLGRVTPSWPSGVPAPVDNPPQVEAGVTVYLDREPLNVTRATLAPGYIGFYLIEVQLPKIVNAGPAEVYVEAAGRSSNRVRLYLLP